ALLVQAAPDRYRPPGRAQRPGWDGSSCRPFLCCFLFSWHNLTQLEELESVGNGECFYSSGSPPMSRYAPDCVVNRAGFSRTWCREEYLSCHQITPPLSWMTWPSISVRSV